MPADNLPNPSILAKLKTFNANAAKEAFSAGEHAETVRIKNERSLRYIWQNAAFWHGFLDGFGSVANVFGTHRATVSRPLPGISSVVQVGDDMRHGIRTIMVAHHISASDLGLTEDEIEDLKPVTPYYKKLKPEIL